MTRKTAIKKLMSYGMDRNEAARYLCDATQVRKLSRNVAVEEVMGAYWKKFWAKVFDSPCAEVGFDDTFDSDCWPRVTYFDDIL